VHVTETEPFDLSAVFESFCYKNTGSILFGASVLYNFLVSFVSVLSPL